jgi:hypothetical protein
MGCNCSFCNGYSVDELPHWIITSENETKKVGSYLPKSQIQKIIDGDKSEGKKPSTKFEIYRNLITLRWSSKICLNCGNYNDDTIFIPCQKCWLNFYCSKKCASQDYKNHSKECQNSSIKYDEIRDKNRFSILKKIGDVPLDLTRYLPNGKKVKKCIGEYEQQMI